MATKHQQDKGVSKRTFAQSSDIKSRDTYQYRLDMKKKGVRELEFLPYLQQILQNKFKDQNLTVSKSGGDALHWFLRHGELISREPDFIAKINGEETKIEFQMANETPKEFFDFKETKLGKKPKNKPRQPYTDRIFFYVVRDKNSYSFLTPKWIWENGSDRFISAWRSQGRSIPISVFLNQCRDGSESLRNILQLIDDKILLLEFQNEIIDIESDAISAQLQKLVDESVEFRIVPRSLEGIYYACFLMNRLNRYPDGSNTWLVYLSSFLNESISNLNFQRFMFSFDFLYFKCHQFAENERKIVGDVLSRSKSAVETRIDNYGVFRVDRNESQIEGTRRLLFSMNLLEDVMQDARFSFGFNFPQVRKIYEMIPDVSKLANEVREFYKSEKDHI